MHIETKSAKELTVTEQARNECVVTSSMYAYQVGTKWAPPDWAVMVWEDEELVSNVHIVERTALVGNQPVKLGGLGNIATKVEWRKRGYAQAALKAAQEFLADPLGVDFGLMMCVERLVPYYEKQGWSMVAQSVLMDQPDGKKGLSYPVMIIPVQKTAWPQGSIDLCGLPW